VAANGVEVVLEKPNNRPKKTLNDQTPANIMTEHLQKIATQMLCTWKLNSRVIITLEFKEKLNLLS